MRQPHLTRITLLIPCILFAFNLGISAEKPTNDTLHDNSSANGKWINADVYVTSKATNERIAKKERLTFEDLEQPDEHTATIIRDKDKAFQSIVGFGGALTSQNHVSFRQSAARRRNTLHLSAASATG